jgi:hypothetical protein
MEENTWSYWHRPRVYNPSTFARLLLDWHDVKVPINLPLFRIVKIEIFTLKVKRRRIQKMDLLFRNGKIRNNYILIVSFIYIATSDVWFHSNWSTDHLIVHWILKVSVIVNVIIWIEPFVLSLHLVRIHNNDVTNTPQRSCGFDVPSV